MITGGKYTGGKIVAGREGTELLPWALPLWSGGGRVSGEVWTGTLGREDSTLCLGQ